MFPVDNRYANNSFYDPTRGAPRLLQYGEAKEPECPAGFVWDANQNACVPAALASSTGSGSGSGLDLSVIYPEGGMWDPADSLESRAAAAAKRVDYYNSLIEAEKEGENRQWYIDNVQGAIDSVIQAGMHDNITFGGREYNPFETNFSIDGVHTPYGNAEPIHTEEEFNAAMDAARKKGELGNFVESIFSGDIGIGDGISGIVGSLFDTLGNSVDSVTSGLNTLLGEPEHKWELGKDLPKNAKGEIIGTGSQNSIAGAFKSFFTPQPQYSGADSTLYERPDYIPDVITMGTSHTELLHEYQKNGGYIDASLMSQAAARDRYEIRRAALQAGLDPNEYDNMLGGGIVTRQGLADRAKRFETILEAIIKDSKGVPIQTPGDDDGDGKPDNITDDGDGKPDTTTDDGSIQVSDDNPFGLTGSIDTQGHYNPGDGESGDSPFAETGYSINEWNDVVDRQNDIQREQYGSADHTCFTGDSVVLTPTGKKAISSIKLGDKVVDIDGNANTVHHIDSPKLGSRQLIGINGGKEFFTWDHPFKTIDGDWVAVSPENNKRAEYLDLGKLEVGTTLADGTVVEELSFKDDSPEIKLYDLYLDGTHEYTVNGFAVHNCNKGGWIDGHNSGGMMNSRMMTDAAIMGFNSGGMVKSKMMTDAAVMGYNKGGGVSAETSNRLRRWLEEMNIKPGSRDEKLIFKRLGINPETRKNAGGKVGFGQGGFNRGGMVGMGQGMMNFNEGGDVPMFANDGSMMNHPYEREGEHFDTIKARLTPGEFVIDADSTHAIEQMAPGLLERLNEWEPDDGEDMLGGILSSPANEEMTVKRKMKDGTEMTIKSPQGTETSFSQDGLLGDLAQPTKGYNTGGLASLLKRIGIGGSGAGIGDPRQAQFARQRAAAQQAAQQRANSAHVNAGLSNLGLGADAAHSMIRGAGLKTNSTGGWGPRGYTPASFSQNPQGAPNFSGQLDASGQGFQEAANARIEGQEVLRGIDAKENAYLDALEAEETRKAERLEDRQWDVEDQERADEKERKKEEKKSAESIQANKESIDAATKALAYLDAGADEVVDYISSVGPQVLSDFDPSAFIPFGTSAVAGAKDDKLNTAAQLKFGDSKQWSAYQSYLQEIRLLKLKARSLVKGGSISDQEGAAAAETIVTGRANAATVRNQLQTVINRNQASIANAGGDAYSSDAQALDVPGELLSALKKGGDGGNNSNNNGSSDVGGILSGAADTVSDAVSGIDGGLLTDTAETVTDFIPGADAAADAIGDTLTDWFSKNVEQTGSTLTVGNVQDINTVELATEIGNRIATLPETASVDFGGTKVDKQTALSLIVKLKQKLEQEG